MIWFSRRVTQAERMLRATPAPTAPMPEFKPLPVDPVVRREAEPAARHRAEDTERVPVGVG